MVEKRLLEQAKILLPRKIEETLRKALSQKPIRVLLGSRQVGKTSLMLRLILYLSEKEQVPPSQIVYLDLEFPQILSQIDGLYGEDFLSFLKARGVNTQEDVFIFIDEVHYLENPSSFLKILHDHYSNLKLTVSGSSSLQIKHKFKETLTGRKRIFEINPLDFEEFLEFKNSPLLERKRTINLELILAEEVRPDISELRFLATDFNKLFEEFIIFGGYPEVILLPSIEDKTALLAEIYRSYIRRDIKDFAKIGNVSAFNNLVELLGYQIGNLINLSELCNSLNISRPTVENHLFLLENTFVISLISPYYTNRRQEIIKSSKVFFHDTGLRNSLGRDFDPINNRIDKGALFENAVWGELHKHLQTLQELHFWRSKSKAEVDFILRDKDMLPLEAKYRPFKKTTIPSGLRSFIKTYQPKAACVITKDFWGQTELNSTPVFFIPGWAM
ncbi:MAG: ATP-binding protein [bacterium]|nr:ATP-binding protein [bacterium]